MVSRARSRRCRPATVARRGPAATSTKPFGKDRARPSENSPSIDHLDPSSPGSSGRQIFWAVFSWGTDGVNVVSSIFVTGLRWGSVVRARHEIGAGLLGQRRQALARGPLYEPDDEDRDVEEAE